MKLLGLDVKRFNRSTFIFTVISSYLLLMLVGSLLAVFFDTKIIVAPLILIWIVYLGFCSVYRLHDLGMSGWWLMLYFVPFANFVILLRLLFESGAKSENKYGECLQATRVMGYVVQRKRI